VLLKVAPNAQHARHDSPILDLREGIIMLWNKDSYKLAMNRAGELKGIIEKARRDRGEQIVSVGQDQTRSKLWKDAQHEKIESEFKSATDAALAEIQQIRQSAIAAGRQWQNPALALHGHPVSGLPETLSVDATSGVIADAALKTEFRSMIKESSPADRKAWYELLVQTQDWGRLGVLVSLDPDIATLAQSLAIPGRDEALSNASSLRKFTEGVLRDDRYQKGLERYQELSLKADREGLSPKEGIEIIQLGEKLKNKFASTEDLPDETKKVTLSDAERSEYAQLSAKPELTKQEGVRIQQLATKLQQEQAGASA